MGKPRAKCNRSLRIDVEVVGAKKGTALALDQAIIAAEFEEAEVRGKGASASFELGDD
jgi:hypothetical protein